MGEWETIGADLDSQTKDYLTGVMNLGYFMESVPEEMDRLHRDGKTPAVVYFNIENFKTFNEKYGFLTGNEYLKDIAGIISSEVKTGFVARFSEDHFVAVTDADDFSRFIERIHERAHKIQRGLVMEVKAGVYIMSGRVDAAAACDYARLACLSVPHRQEHVYRVYDMELEEHAKRRDYIMKNLDEALENGYIHVYFQPLIRASTGSVYGAEALSRWIDPTYGFMNPGIFISVLEQTGMIYKLDSFMIREICRHYRSNEDRGVKNVPVSVNISRVDFEHGDMLRVIEVAEKEFKVPKDMIHVEVTESALNEDPVMLRREVERFQEHGHAVWMDGFGSGYSSLSLFHEMSFDLVKFDMAFLRNFDKNKKTRGILMALVHMVKQLGVQTLVEGVETPEQVDFLRSIGVDKLQGYYFSKPIPAEEIDAWVAEHDACGESRDNWSYYDAIGRADIVMPSYDNSSEGALSWQTSAAIIEYRNGELNLLSINQAGIDYFQKNGYKGFADIRNELTISWRPLNRRIIQAAERAIANNSSTEFDFVNHGKYAMITMRPIAHNIQNGSYALLLTIMDVGQIKVREHEENSDNLLRQLYTMFNEVDLIDMKNDMVSGVFQSESFNNQIYMQLGVSSVVRSFADEYIHADDQQKFRKFYDMATIRERFAHTQEGFLSEIFRVKSGERYEWSVFTIHMLEPLSSERFLSCVFQIYRDMGEMSGIVFPDVRNEHEREMIAMNVSERMKRESSLWRSLITMSDVHVFWKDRNRRFLGASRSFLDYYGFHSVNEIIGKTDEDMHWHVDPIPFQSDEMGVLNEGRSTVNVRGRCISHGQIRTIIACKNPVMEHGKIVGLVGYFRDVTDIVGADGDTPKSLEMKDNETGLLNYQGLCNSLNQYQIRFGQLDMDFMLMYISIDNFAEIEEMTECGSGALLSTVASYLRYTMHNEGIVAHYGGNVFVCVMQFEDVKQPAVIRDAISEKFTKAVMVNGKRVNMPVSVGSAVYSEVEDVHHLIELARQRMRMVREKKGVDIN